MYKLLKKLLKNFKNILFNKLNKKKKYGIKHARILKIYEYLLNKIQFCDI